SYNGEWAWYNVIKDNKSNSIYSIIFNNNKNLYFDFEIINGASELNNIVYILNNLKIVENITGVNKQ
ncbi:hypothetical protein, partial [Campylobacter jejuni]|uniref:hypothetical protein n=1 Tax=Campylobacter jejuni TaxID=197 RepID=UPI000CBCDF11